MANNTLTRDFPRARGTVPDTVQLNAIKANGRASKLASKFLAINEFHRTKLPWETEHGLPGKNKNYDRSRWRIFHLWLPLIYIFSFVLLQLLYVGSSR